MWRLLLERWHKCATWQYEQGTWVLSWQNAELSGAYCFPPWNSEKKYGRHRRTGAFDPSKLLFLPLAKANFAGGRIPKQQQSLKRAWRPRSRTWRSRCRDFK